MAELLGLGTAACSFWSFRRAFLGLRYPKGGKFLGTLASLLRPGILSGPQCAEAKKSSFPTKIEDLLTALDFVGLAPCAPG
jgi:hypothetical protein